MAARDRVGGMEGHVSRDCTMEAKAKSCYKCGQEGHIVRVSFVRPSRRTHCVHSRVTAPRASVAPAPAMVADSAVGLVRSATAVARLDTLHARVPRALGMRGMAAEASVVGLVGVVEARLGAHAVVASTRTHPLVQLHVRRCRPSFARLCSRVQVLQLLWHRRWCPS